MMKLKLEEYSHLKLWSMCRLCIKPGIQERGTECGEPREWGECYILGNIAKHCGECPQTFWGMSSNIPGNVAKHSAECHKTFQGMSQNIPGNLAKHSRECPQTFRGMSPNIPGNITKHSGECRQAFRGMSSNISGNVARQKNFFSKQTFLQNTNFSQRCIQNPFKYLRCSVFA